MVTVAATTTTTNNNKYNKCNNVNSAAHLLRCNHNNGKHDAHEQSRICFKPTSCVHHDNERQRGKQTFERTN